MENWSDIKESQIIINYMHYGYVFKIPIFCYNQNENTPGLIMTSLMFLAANGLSYWAMVRHNNQKDVTKSKKISNAWNKYESN